MNQEERLEKFRQWSDSQLLAEYAQIDEYEQTAAEGIIIVLKERGLWEEIERRAVQEMKQTEIDREKESTLIQERAQKRKEQEQAFVQSLKAEDGVYLDVSLSSSLSQAAMFLFGGIALAAWIIVFIYPSIESQYGSFYWITLFCSILFTLLAFRSYLKGKGKLRILEKGKESIQIEVKFHNQSFLITSPLNCEFYADRTQVKINGINANYYYTLYIIFHTDCGKRINIFEDQGARIEPPPGWEFISYNDERNKGDYVFAYKGKSKMKLKKLRLLLDQYLIDA
ncbi:MAG: hypothetical protein WDZ35_08580 [Crocinitomicaceae bacterium]